MKRRIAGSIRNKLILAFTLIIALPMIALSVLTFVRFGAALENTQNETVAVSLGQTVNTIDAVIDSVIAASNAVMLDSDIMRILSDGEGLDTPQGRTFTLEDFLVLDEKVAAFQTLFLISNQTYLTIVDQTGRVYRNWSAPQSPYERIVSADWYAEAMRQNGRILWVGPHDPYQGVESDAKNYISLVRMLRKPHASKALGVLMLSIREDEFTDRIFADVKPGADTYTVVLNGEGAVLAAADQGMVGSPLECPQLYADAARSGAYRTRVAGRDVYLNFDTVHKTGWRVVQISDYQALMRPIASQRFQTIAITLFLLLAFGVVAVLVVIRTTGPLIEIGRLMGEVENGRFGVRYECRSQDEIGKLADSFNRMTERIRALIEQIGLDQARKQELTLQVMQAQVNPHFLFNTLNMIRITAKMNQDTAVEAMLVALGSLLELSMKKSAEIISLRVEVHAVQSYVHLQKMRFASRFEMQYELEPGVMDCAIPKFTLQPLVENSILHGMDAAHRYLNIVLQGRREGDDVLLTLTDDGAGMPEEQLSALLLTPKPQQPGGFNGIGLAAVHERIRLHFGPAYGLTVENVPGGGFCTTIRIPWKGVEEDDRTHRG